MKYYLFLFFCIVNGTAFSQKQPGRSINIINSYQIKDLHLIVYDSSAKIKPIYSSINEAKYSTPEETMCSIISTSTIEWDNNNRLPDKPYNGNRRYNKFNKEEINKNYFLLLHKVEFTYDTLKMAYIKYGIFQNDVKVVTGLTVLKYVNDRWYQDGVDKGFEKFSQVIWQIKSDVFFDLLSAKEEKEVVKFFKNIYRKDSLIDLDKLYDQYSLWKENNKNQYFRFFESIY